MDLDNGLQRIIGKTMTYNRSDGIIVVSGEPAQVIRKNPATVATGSEFRILLDGDGKIVDISGEGLQGEGWVPAAQ